MAGSIQGDINQALGTLGVLAQLSPQLQEHAENMAENRKLDKRQKVLDKQQKVSNQDLQKKFTPNAEGDIIIDPQTESELRQSRKELMRQNKEQEDISRKKYDLNPTLENYQRWQTDAAINQNLKDAYANIAKQKKAMARKDRLQEAKKKQWEEIMAYLAQYSDEEIRNMMNQMDREANNGKSN